MLKYSLNESENGSHFFINTQLESMYMLSFQKLDAEQDIDFDNDFLQENMMQMTIALLSEKREHFHVELSKTIKHIFDNMLLKKKNLILYVSVESDKCKNKLIERFINDDNNDDITYLDVNVGDYTMYFFVNRDKTDAFYCIGAIMEYFQSEYGIDLTYSD